MGKRRQIRPYLRPFAILFYADRNLGVLIHHRSMQRLTARFLLLFALVGTFVPLALAATSAPQHACCLRKGVHQCHGSAPEANQRSIRDTSCCHHDCCRAVTTPQWANAQPPVTPPFAQNVEAHIAESHSDFPATKLFSSLSARAPPQVSVA